ncbi:MAG: DUF4296 domain-containing protein [Bacteroidetes bacterium]|nr:DUF4296 domain-containing protein [Bacteroidota bacterium]
MKLNSENIFLIGCLHAVLLLSISCSKKPADIPKNILSKTELVPVLVDIHLAQAATGVNQLNDSARYGMKEYSGYIFKIHGITKEKYDSSLAFYSRHPELIDEIYQEVINELSRKQSEEERK